MLSIPNISEKSLYLVIGHVFMILRLFKDVVVKYITRKTQKIYILCGT